MMKNKCTLIYKYNAGVLITIALLIAFIVNCYVRFNNYLCLIQKFVYTSLKNLVIAIVDLIIFLWSLFNSLFKI